jgi:hypothetical protein
MLTLDQVRASLAEERRRSTGSSYSRRPSSRRTFLFKTYVPRITRFLKEARVPRRTRFPKEAPEVPEGSNFFLNVLREASPLAAF